MKEKKHWGIIIVALLVAIGLAIVLSFYEDQKERYWFQLLTEIDKWVIISGFLGSIAKIIGEDIYTIKRNNKALTNLGVTDVIPGKLPINQTNIMFGFWGYKRPFKFKAFFISGEKFIGEHFDNLKRLLENDCELDFLLANSNSEAGKRYLDGLALLKDSINYNSYANCLLLAQNCLNKMCIESKKKIKVRFYDFEYSNSFRIAYYDKVQKKQEKELEKELNEEEKRKKEKERDEQADKKLWVSFSPLISEPKDSSLSVAATSKNKNDFVIQHDFSFEKVWNNYKSTEITFPIKTITYSGTISQWNWCYQELIKNKELRQYGFTKKSRVGSFEAIKCSDGDIII